MSTDDPIILPTALAWRAEGRRVALATVIQTWGSAPRPVGSQLVIDGSGNFLGSVSGGCVEGEVIAEVPEVLTSAKSKTLEFGVENDAAWKVGLTCGGTIRIFLEPLEALKREHDGVLSRIAGDIAARRKVALITELTTGTRRIAHTPDDLGPELAPALVDAFLKGRSSVLEGSAGEIFIRIFNPTTRLIVIGAVHIAQPLVPMARALGWEVVIVDPREAFATVERFRNTEIVQDWPEEALAALGLDASTAVVVLSHDKKIDDPALIAALSSDAFYVGALGSKKTHAKRVERLLAAGVPEADIARIHAPIGLDLGALDAAEIALSIIAEITATQRGKDGARK
ncbi:MAG TPA: XdhC family protein [Methyloceanibacter sp.]|nr:XdhC family protein [Methyloceanibacter sp.]